MLALLWMQAIAHCFDVAKKTLLSENTYDMLTRARPKTLPKKVLKNSFGGPSEQCSPGQEQKMRKRVKYFDVAKKKATPEREHT